MPTSAAATLCPISAGGPPSAPMVTTMPSTAATPQAIVEDMGDAPNWTGCENEIPRQPNCSTRRFRVTARSTADGRATVLVQSQFAAP